jgi:4-diphosphocytidyl-2-C-methyl-D-erythritol kinase
VRSPSPGQAFETEAPAKVNLFLHVRGRRPDGYHDLASLIAFADIADTVHVAPASEFRFVVQGPMAAALSHGDDEDNLCVRAARGLAARLGRKPDLALTLVKRLPVASGIGGGSADAAATIRALCRFWGAEVPQAEMTGFALSLGADVPVCLLGSAAEIFGVGDDVRPVPPMPGGALVLVNPGVELPTARVFHGWNGVSPETPAWTPPPTAAALAAALMKRRNDLTDSAVSLVPAIAEVLSALAARPDCLLARMSGSGATCFGLFEDFEVASAAAEIMQATHPAWWVRAARLLVAPPPVRLAGPEAPVV